MGDEPIDGEQAPDEEDESEPVLFEKCECFRQEKPRGLAMSG